MRTELLLAGSGGRGVILAGAIMAKAASKAGLNAAYGAIYGAEVRGGLTAAEIVVCDHQVDFPFPERPHLTFAFDQKSYHRYVLEHEPRKLLLLDGDYIQTEKEHTVPVIRVPFTEMASDKLGRPTVANIIVVGFIAGLTGLFQHEHGLDALREDVSEKFFQMDATALSLGFDKAKDYVQHWK